MEMMGTWLVGENRIIPLTSSLTHSLGSPLLHWMYPSSNESGRSLKHACIFNYAALMMISDSTLFFGEGIDRLRAVM